MNTTMKNWFKSSTNRTFATVLFTLILFNIFATITNNTMLLQVSKALSIPLFFSIYFIKNKTMNTIFILFLLLAFVGDIFSVLPSNAMPFKITSAAYFCCYAVLIFIGLTRIKTFKFKGVISSYLIVVSLLNIYFLFSLYGLMSGSIPDSTELFFTTLQIVSILVLGFVAFAGYLNKDNRQSILFLLLSICLIFSQALNLIEMYYVSFSLFVVLEWTAYSTALILFYMYLAGYNKVRSNRINTDTILITDQVVA